MDEAEKYKIKAFMWDQFVRPTFLLFNLHQVKAILLALTIFSVAMKWDISFWVAVIPLSFIFILEIIRYYKSGEYLYNYRKYKYSDYKKATKVFKRKEREKINNDDQKETDGETGQVGTPSS